LQFKYLSEDLLTIHGSQEANAEASSFAGEVSYRMTASRFDWKNWSNLYIGNSTGMKVELKGK